ncbi:hypothetical protein FXO38_29453 [Capsicum annuum]|nr:hypothetical protein FXO38_29453 [Capsicum annuum]KAF3684155.1 hypothetical protein FXO37_01484 [Capsicum annuum]
MTGTNLYHDCLHGQQGGDVHNTHTRTTSSPSFGRDDTCNAIVQQPFIDVASSTISDDPMNSSYLILPYPNLGNTNNFDDSATANNKPDARENPGRETNPAPAEPDWASAVRGTINSKQYGIIFSGTSKYHSSSSQACEYVNPRNGESLRGYERNTNRNYCVKGYKNNGVQR